VRRFGPGMERSVVSGLVLLCALCCLCIARSTVDLERANARRCAQLRLFGRIAADPQQMPLGPIAALDGLFVRRLAVVPTVLGPTFASWTMDRRRRPNRRPDDAGAAAPAAFPPALAVGSPLLLAACLGRWLRRSCWRAHSVRCRRPGGSATGSRSRRRRWRPKRLPSTSLRPPVSRSGRRPMPARHRGRHECRAPRVARTKCSSRPCRRSAVRVRVPAVAGFHAAGVRHVVRGGARSTGDAGRLARSHRRGAGRVAAADAGSHQLVH